MSMTGSEFYQTLFRFIFHFVFLPTDVTLGLELSPSETFNRKPISTTPKGAVIYVSSRVPASGFELMLDQGRPQVDQYPGPK